MERTLSRTEAKVVLALEWRQQKTITLAQLRQALGVSEGYARKLAHGLVEKGWFERLRPGLFLLVPADRGRKGVADMNPLAAGAVLVSPYFYSFGTACTHRQQLYAEKIATGSPSRSSRKSIWRARSIVGPRRSATSATFSSTSRGSGSSASRR